jgi:hypothetical protein
MNHALVWRHLALAVGGLAIIVGLLRWRRPWGRATVALGVLIVIGTFAIDPELRQRLAEGFRSGSSGPR